MPSQMQSRLAGSQSASDISLRRFKGASPGTFTPQKGGSGTSTPAAGFVPRQPSPTPAKSPTQEFRSLDVELRPPSKREEALVEALQASQAANDALEAVVKMQAEALANVYKENKRLWKHAQESEQTASLKMPMPCARPRMCEAPTEILPEEAKFILVGCAVDAEVQTFFEDKVPDSPPASPITPTAAPQASPRIAFPTAPLSSPREAAPAPLPTPRIQEPSRPENTTPKVEGLAELNIGNASPFVAEAFRLGWLAGVKSNNLAANRSPSSTRSDDSPPSDPGSYVMGSIGDISSGSNSGSESPPECNRYPTPMMPPPPPPKLLPPPPPAAFSIPAQYDQLG